MIYSQPQRNVDGKANVESGRVYSISAEREVRILEMSYPTEYERASARGLFAGEEKLLALVRASQPKNPDEVLGRGQSVSFLSIADTEGGRTSLVKLSLTFQPMKAAIFDSGKLLVLGYDTANLVPVLALLHEDGTLAQMFDLDPRVYQRSEELQKMSAGRRADPNSPASQRLVNRAMLSAEFVPWGKAILLVQPGTKLPIYKLTDAGTQEEVKVHLPGDQTLRRVLGSGERDTWVVVSRGPRSSQQGTYRGLAERIKDFYFEVDPYSGAVIDQLTVEEPDEGEIGCAANGKLSGIYRDYKDDSEEHLQVTYASAPR